MFLTKIELTNFRNYQQVYTQVNPYLNIIVGDNAQGKTNLLESIYLAAVGKSHRTNKDQELIRWNENFFRIKLTIDKGSSPLNLEIIYNQEKKKQYKINGVNKTKLAELLGNFNAVLFAPEHLTIVKGSPSERRRFLDSEISQTNPAYYHNLAQYLRVLTQRNNLLKMKKNDRTLTAQLEVWNLKLAELGTKVITKRIEVLKKLNPLARLVHRKITAGSENLEISYHSVLGNLANLSPVQIHQLFQEQIQVNLQQELARGFSLVGPHRDDLILKVNDYDIRVYGSQGQQRTTALALKLAELEFIKAETGQYPVLLLDDVMSELDLSRRTFLLETIHERIQTFFTSTNLNYFPEKYLQKAAVYQIKQGQIEA